MATLSESDRITDLLLNGSEIDTVAKDKLAVGSDRGGGSRRYPLDSFVMVHFLPDLSSWGGYLCSCLGKCK